MHASMRFFVPPTLTAMIFSLCSCSLCGGSRSEFPFYDSTARPRSSDEVRRVPSAHAKRSDVEHHIDALHRLSHSRCISDIGEPKLDALLVRLRHAQQPISVVPKGTGTARTENVELFARTPHVHATQAKAPFGGSWEGRPSTRAAGRAGRALALGLPRPLTASERSRGEASQEEQLKYRLFDL